MDEAIRHGFDREQIKDSRNSSQSPAAGTVLAEHVTQQENQSQDDATHRQDPGIKPFNDI